MRNDNQIKFSIGLLLIVLCSLTAQSQFGLGPLFEREPIKLKSKALNNFKLLRHNGKVVILDQDRRNNIRIPSENMLLKNKGYVEALSQIANASNQTEELYDALSNFQRDYALTRVNRSRMSEQEKKFKKREILDEIRDKEDLQKLVHLGQSVSEVSYASYNYFPDYNFDKGEFIFNISNPNGTCRYTFKATSEMAQEIVSNNNIYLEIREKTSNGFKYYLYPNTTSGEPFVVFTSDSCW